jgi:hypothetical protein
MLFPARGVVAMSLGRFLSVLLLLSALTACSGGDPGGPTDGGTQPGDSGTASIPVLPDAASWETTAGVPFERALGAAGGTGELTYTSQGLPAGLALDARTGRLSGTPSIPGRSELDVSVKDSAGRGDQKRYVLSVLQAPGFVTSSLPEALSGSPYTARLEASGGKPPLAYSASAGTLPPGLSLESSGALSGTPSAPGTFTFEASVTDAYGAVARASFTIEVRNGAPVLVTEVLPSAFVTQPYRFTLTVAGGNPPYTWSRVQGAFPAGISLSASGELSGTPSSLGTSAFTLEVRDALGQAAQKAFTLAVLSQLAITTTALPDAYGGTPYPASGSLQAVGGVPPYAWDSLSGALPPGMSLGADGRISGTPTASGIFSFTARVTDSAGNTSSRALTLTAYVPPAVTAKTLGDGYVGEPYSGSISATEGKPPYTYSVSGALPPGLTLNSNGVFTGTPTAAATSSFEVTARDVNGRTGSRTFSLAVYAPVALSGVVPEARQGQFYSHALSVSGGKPDYTFAVVSDAPPVGLSLASNGVISGTPTGTGRSFGVRVSDVNGRATARTISLPVYFPPSITTTSLPEAMVNTAYGQAIVFTGGADTLNWSYTGALPPGLSMSGNATVQGTPSVAGTWSFTFTVQDNRGAMASRTFTITVRAPPPSAPLTVAQWNIEWFGSDTNGPPRSTSPGGSLDDLQIANARSVLLDAGVNLWGLVEITDDADFQALKAQLPGYDGFLADDPRVPQGSNYYGPTEQKVGVLFDSRFTFQSASLILTSAANDFAGRPPLRVDFLTSINGAPAPLTLIVLHMKAFADQTSYDRRQRAGTALKNYLDAMPSSRVIVVGDWNDDVDQSITFSGGVPLPSPYESFNQDFNDYAFITRPLSLAGEASTTGFPDMIDHTLVTDEVLAHYLANSVHVLRPGWITDFDGTTSDHYPVLSYYDFAAAPEPLSITLTGPAGGTYPGNSELTFTWQASANIATVMLSYSLDAGASWNEIGTLPASESSYTWMVPNVGSTQVLLRVAKSDTGTPRDISDTPLTFVYVPPPPLIFINEVLPNEPSGQLPDGTTGALTDYEFVELYNGDSAPVDLSGWTLWDGNTTGGARHVFAQGTMLLPGQVWVVYGGATAFPAGTPNTVAASSGRLALNNSGGETVTLKTPSGTTVSEFSYQTTEDNVSFNRELDGNRFTSFVLHTQLSALSSSAGRRSDGTAF